MFSFSKGISILELVTSLLLPSRITKSTGLKKSFVSNFNNAFIMIWIWVHLTRLCFFQPFRGTGSLIQLTCPQQNFVTLPRLEQKMQNNYTLPNEFFDPFFKTGSPCRTWKGAFYMNPDEGLVCTCVNNPIAFFKQSNHRNECLCNLIRFDLQPLTTSAPPRLLQSSNLQVIKST